MITLVKFIPRDTSDPSRRNGDFQLATRTLGKIGLINIGWAPPEGTEPPKSEEFWFVRILRETHVGRNNGCFILKPLRRVMVDDIHRLLPGFYTQKQPNSGTLVVTPKQSPKAPWLLPLELKRELSAKLGLAAVVVNLGGEYWHYGQASVRKGGQNSPQKSTENPT